MKFGSEMTLEKELNQYLELYPNENEKINRMIHLLKQILIVLKTIIGMDTLQDLLGL